MTRHKGWKGEVLAALWLGLGGRARRAGGWVRAVASLARLPLTSADTLAVSPGCSCWSAVKRAAWAEGGDDQGRRVVSPLLVRERPSRQQESHKYDQQLPQGPRHRKSGGLGALPK